MDELLLALMVGETNICGTNLTLFTSHELLFLAVKTASFENRNHNTYQDNAPHPSRKKRRSLAFLLMQRYASNWMVPIDTLPLAATTDTFKEMQLVESQCLHLFWRESQLQTPGSAYSIRSDDSPPRPQMGIGLPHNIKRCSSITGWCMCIISGSDI